MFLAVHWFFSDTVVGNVSGGLLGTHEGTILKGGNPQPMGWEPVDKHFSMLILRGHNSEIPFLVYFYFKKYIFLLF